MNTCEHQRHPIVTFSIYLITGLALVLHILSHMLPIVILLHSKWLECIIEHPLTTCIALAFIPLSIYHLWQDNRMHETVHRLTKERDEALAQVAELKRGQSQACWVSGKDSC
jgi:hypothetical protein